MKKNGFTLIELLVVIAIVSILWAIISPVFATAREKARQTTCLGNLRQIGLAMSQYANDFDDTCPGAAQGEPGIQVAGGWVYRQGPGVFHPDQGALFVYVRDLSVYLCPDDVLGQEAGNSYAMSSRLLRHGEINGLRSGRKLAAFGITNRVIAFGERFPSGALDAADDGVLDYDGPAEVSIPHQRGANFLYLDGHVKRDQFDSWSAKPPLLRKTGNWLHVLQKKGENL